MGLITRPFSGTCCTRRSVSGCPCFAPRRPSPAKRIRRRGFSAASDAVADDDGRHGDRARPVAEVHHLATAAVGKGNHVEAGAVGRLKEQRPLRVVGRRRGQSAGGIAGRGAPCRRRGRLPSSGRSWRRRRRVSRDRRRTGQRLAEAAPPDDPAAGGRQPLEFPADNIDEEDVAARFGGDVLRREEREPACRASRSAGATRPCPTPHRRRRPRRRPRPSRLASRPAGLARLALQDQRRAGRRCGRRKPWSAFSSARRRLHQRPLRLLRLFDGLDQSLVADQLRIFIDQGVVAGEDRGGRLSARRRRSR